MTNKQQELYDKFIEMINRGDNEQAIIDTVDELLDTYIKPLEVLKNHLKFKEVKSTINLKRSYMVLGFIDNDGEERLSLFYDKNEEELKTLLEAGIE